MRRHQLQNGFILIVGLVLGLSPWAQAGSTIYDLAADWSDTSNPDGTWTYLAAPGVPLTSHLSDWDPNRQVFTAPQPVWAYGTFPNQGQIPLFMKVASLFVDSQQNDAPIGSVVIHNNDPSNSPSGLGDQPMGVAWTAPSAGTIQISGGLWEVERSLGRSENWALEINGVTVSSETLTSSSSFTSSTPLNLSSGSGGAGALAETVAAGDVVSLIFTRPPGEDVGTLMGVNFTIQLSSVPEPSSVVLMGLGATGLLCYSRARRRRYHQVVPV